MEVEQNTRTDAAVAISGLYALLDVLANRGAIDARELDGIRARMERAATISGGGEAARESVARTMAIVAEALRD